MVGKYGMRAGKIFIHILRKFSAFWNFIIYMNSLEDSDDDNDVDYVPTRIDLEHIVH